MNRALIATRLFNVPLLASQSYADVFVSALADDLGLVASATAEAMEMQMRPTRYPAVYGDQNGVAVVPIVGALVHRAGPAQTMSAMQGYAGTQNLLMQLAADDSVNGILLDMDTPGGEVGGVMELGEAIKEIAKTKPVWALANPLSASAGMWIAASTSRVLATPFARVGSIGVVTMHMDISKQAEKRGVAVSFIHAGKHKVAGNAFAALDDETRARMQSLIDDTYGDFVAHVAAGRNMTEKAVRDTEAMVYSAKEALEIGLVDGISTLGEAIAQMRDHLGERRKIVNIQGNRTMDQAALDTARTEGRAEGVTSERARITGILAHESAKDRPALAQMLITTAMSIEDAGKVMGAAAKETAATPVVVSPVVSATVTDATATAAALLALREGSPKIEGDGAKGDNAKATRQAELAANMKPFQARSARQQ